MSIEKFDISPENNYHGDPSLPRVTSTTERPEMLRKLAEKGLTEDEAEAEVERQEIAITNKQAQAVFEKERKVA